MSTRRVVGAGIFLMATASLLNCGSVQAQEGKKTATGSTAEPTATTAGGGKLNDADLLNEGERRFHANCGRCHQAPHKLAPRMMATAIRHMRVRGTITDEDMRAILAYMTQ